MAHGVGLYIYIYTLHIDTLYKAHIVEHYKDVNHTLAR